MLSQVVTNLQTQKQPQIPTTTFSTQDAWYQQLQQEATRGHTHGIYQKVPPMVPHLLMTLSLQYHQAT